MGEIHYAMFTKRSTTVSTGCYMEINKVKVSIILRQLAV